MKGDVSLRYIGSKINLLDQIEKIINEKVDGTEETFLDLFGGTNTVGVHFRSRYKVISNDLLYFSYQGALARIAGNQEYTFKGIYDECEGDPIGFLNRKANEYVDTLNEYEGYYESSYSSKK